MIADRNKVCDHMETSSAIVCDPTIAEDRTMFYLKAGFHMIADDRRPYCDLRYGNQPLLSSGVLTFPVFGIKFSANECCYILLRHSTD